MARENFQIYGAQITGKCIYESRKLKVEIFTNANQQNSTPGSHHHPPGRRKFLIPSQVAFFKKSIWEGDGYGGWG